VATAAPSAPRKPNAGWFKPGNRAALTTGMESEQDQVPAGLDYLRAATESFLAGALVDEGGPAEIPTRRAAQLEYRARLHRRILQLDSALELRGLVDRRGKLRVAWLSKLESLISAAVRIDNLLGLARRARPTQTPQEWLSSLPDRQHDGGRQDAHAHDDDTPDTDTERTDAGELD
jgi:hypothetical protein